MDVSTVIAECLRRQSSDTKVCKVTGSPTQTFGDDDVRYVSGYVSGVNFSCKVL